MQEAEYRIPEGSLYYIRQGHGLEITRYNGLAGQVVIPQYLPWSDPAKGADPKEESLLPVKKIAKKAFLSKKYLRSVTVPAGVEEVGDWAFGYCDSLREVKLEGRRVRFGKAVFLECAGLRRISLPEETKAPSERIPEDACAALLAAAVTQMDSQYLLDAEEAGTPEWVGKWDARMLAILHGDDSDGYSKQILCGEEDYESADLETYLAGSRKRKVRLLLLRLLFPVWLGPEHEKELKEYLLAHTKGCRTEETWQVVLTECGDRREFYELFATLGCFTKDNAAAVISQIGEEYPEMKAFFLKYQADHFAAGSFFKDLEL